MKNNIFKKTIAQEIARLERLVALESTRTTVQTTYRYPNAALRHHSHRKGIAHQSLYPSPHRPSALSFFARIAHAFSFFL